jgi:RNA recognition motif-containing protein
MPEAADPSGASRQGAARNTDAAGLILETRKLFLRNLPFSTTDAEILSLMRQYGEVEEAHVMRDRSTGKSKGFAIVRFSTPINAVSAFEELDGSIFQGRLLHILPGKPHKVDAVSNAEDEAGKKGGYKAERDKKRKEGAHDKTVWSTFYMREDTVAQAISDLLGVSKAEILDPEAPDAAVRMALGEAQACHSLLARALADQLEHVHIFTNMQLAFGLLCALFEGVHVAGACGNEGRAGRGWSERCCFRTGRPRFWPLSKNHINSQEPYRATD